MKKCKKDKITEMAKQLAKSLKKESDKKDNYIFYD